ncbi:MarR family transcriptional regulator [Romboutsia weinsteinii]|uniref:MarR family transcriptional regulator n=1 Tax=Romboutsia weinsteinii TaxID=2020949 RepID=A0A371J3D4_9FIRM|nr:MarR family transcriptional regulator [Romboutsia weinsteinii]RDY27289.1 MarR family transcriptional regulator [Romboutsia weinsteinii]
MENGCIFTDINKISTISNKFLSKRIKEERLPILQNHVLLFYILPKDGSPLIFSEISSIWQISKSSLSDIINKYEHLGLINKCVSAEDKRSVYVSLNPDGVRIKNKLKTIENEILNLMLEKFDEDEKLIFEKNIKKALMNIEKVL